jgi:hypothetical protein
VATHDNNTSSLQNSSMGVKWLTSDDDNEKKEEKKREVSWKETRKRSI